MKRKLLFAVVALLCSVGSWADIVPTASVPTTGTSYYLYNPVTQKFLFASTDTIPYVQFENAQPWIIESSDTEGYYKLRLKDSETGYFWGKWWALVDGSYANYSSETLFRIDQVGETSNYQLYANAWGTTANAYVYISSSATVYGEYNRVACNYQDQTNVDVQYTYWQFVTESDYATYIAAKYGTDKTELVTNPTFESNVEGWTATGNFQNSQKANNRVGAFSGYFWENWKSNEENGGSANKMYQTVNSISNGIYTLRMAAYVNFLDAENQYVFANDDKTHIAGVTPTFYEVQTLVKNNTLSIGLEQTSTKAGWMGIDNVRLYYLGNEVAYYSPTSFDGDDDAEENTWYAFTVESAGVYKMTSSAAATIRYTQDDSEDADTGGSTVSLDEDGYIVMKLSAGTFYFKSNANSTITISTTLANGDDVTTALITNPSFENNSDEGWTDSKNVFAPANGSALSGKSGDYYEASSLTNQTVSITQTLSGLPTGKYILQVRGKTSNHNGEDNTLSSGSLSLGGNSVSLRYNVEDDYYVAYEAAADNASASVSFGGKFSSRGYFYCDNFTLTYYTTLPDVSISDLLNNAMDGSVRAALKSASATYEASKTVANYNALQTAIVNAKNSIASPSADNDYTDYITNPSFETGYALDPVTGWTVTVSGGSATGTNARYKSEGGFGADGGSIRFFIWTATAGAATVKQTLSNLPAGNYKLSAYMASGAGSTFTLTAGSTVNTVFATGGTDLVEVYFTQAETGDVEIKAGYSSSWFDLDNFKLTYNPTLPASLTGETGYMEASVASAQTTAVEAYNDDNTFANMLAAQTAIRNAVLSEVMYNSIATIKSTYDTKANALDEDGQAAYEAAIDVTSTGANYMYEHGGYTNTSDAETAFKRDYITGVKGQTTENTDMTEAIVNPSFESATAKEQTTMTGWTNSGMKTQNNDSFGGKAGTYYVEQWHSTGDKSIKQTLTGLHSGVYELTAAAYAGDATGKVYVIVGEGDSIKTEVSTSQDYTVRFELLYDNISSVEIGFSGNMGSDASTGWLCADNFRLTYVEALTPTALYDEDDIMNADVKSAANAAITAYNTNQTSANYETMQTAISAAEASKTAYASVSSDDIAAYRTKMGNVLANTNVYTTTAYNKWYANVEDNYTDGVYTDDEVVTLKESGAYDTGWHSASRIDDVLLSTWTISEVQAKDFDTSLYINTWSTEGNNDGSAFYTPFFEYWTNDANDLGATSLVATLPGLAPSTEYTCTIWARVRQKNSSTKVANSITMTVGSGSAVDLTSGSQVGSSQFYIDHFTATGSTNASGTLTVTIAVSASSNISWLAFRDVQVKADVPVAAKAGKYGTVIFPFTPDVSSGFDDITFYTCASTNNGYVQLTEETEPAANVPYIIKNGGEENFSTTLSGMVTASADTYVTSYTDEAELLTGVYTAQTIPVSDGSNTRYVLQTLDGTQAFYKVDAAFTANPYKCYLTVPVASGVKAFYFEDGLETPVESIDNEQLEMDNTSIYNLAGQRVSKPTKGLYIVNGKKVMMK